MFMGGVGGGEGWRWWRWRADRGGCGGEVEAARRGPTGGKVTGAATLLVLTRTSASLFS